MDDAFWLQALFAAFWLFIFVCGLKTNSIVYNGKKDDFENGKLKELKIKINPDFAYLINDVRKNYTEYDLQEFLSIKGKYTRTLYQNLKKFRSTGILRVKWENFLDLMGISETYQSGDIDKRILKPSVKVLGDIFQNIAYTKIKQKGRGRGGKVVAIEFVFKPQTNINSQKAANNACNQKASSNTYNRKSPSSAFSQKSSSNAYNQKTQSNSYSQKAANNVCNQKTPENTYNRKSPSNTHNHTAPSSAFSQKAVNNVCNNDEMYSLNKFIHQYGVEKYPMLAKIVAMAGLK